MNADSHCQLGPLLSALNILAKDSCKGLPLLKMHNHMGGTLAHKSVEAWPHNPQTSGVGFKDLRGQRRHQERDRKDRSKLYG